MSMNLAIKTMWTAALRSGEYEQGTRALNVDGKYCCLGVLCELAVKAGVVEKGQSGGIYWYGIDSYLLPEEVREWAGLPGYGEVSYPNNPEVVMGAGEAVSLATLNDGADDWEKHSFDEIADIIDVQL